MIDINEINDEITKLEVGDTTWNTCEKLSVLYNVRSNFAPEEPTRIARTPMYSMASSEFTEVASQVPIEDLLEVLDKHMDNLKLIYPKEYESILRKLRGKNGTP